MSMWLLMVGNIAANEHDHKILIEMLIFFQIGFLEMRLLLLGISVLLRLLIDLPNRSQESLYHFFLPLVECENAHLFKYPAIPLPHFNLHCLLPVRSDIFPFVYISHFQISFFCVCVLCLPLAIYLF